MKDFQYWMMKFRSKFSKNPKEYVSTYFRNMGMSIGCNCNICDNITSTEPFLIHLGNNVTLAGGVLFVTHDNCISKIIPNTTDLLGNINIGNNCFIGNRAIILYGVTLADNIVVAAGSVVTKSFNREGVIIAGNPARIINTVPDLKEKVKNNAFNLDNIPQNERSKQIVGNPKLINR